MRTLATVWTTFCVAFVSLGVAAYGACSSGGARNAGGNSGEVRAMNDNSTNSVGTNSGGADSQGSQGANASQTPNAARPDSATDPGAGLKPQLELKADIRRESGGDIVVEYSVTNRGERSVLLVNRGDTSFGLGPGRVYVEPQAGGILNLTQRGYMLPPGYAGPAPTAAIYPGVSELAPGATANETVRVSAPKSRQHPYGRYYPEVPVPEPLRRVRFCLGVVAGDAPAKTTQGTLVLTSLQAVAAQELLCSEPQELK